MNIINTVAILLGISAAQAVDSTTMMAQPNMPASPLNQQGADFAMPAAPARSSTVPMPGQISPEPTLADLGGNNTDMAVMDHMGMDHTLPEAAMLEQPGSTLPDLNAPIDGGMNANNMHNAPEVPDYMKPADHASQGAAGGLISPDMASPMPSAEGAVDPLMSHDVDTVPAMPNQAVPAANGRM